MSYRIKITNRLKPNYSKAGLLNRNNKLKYETSKLKSDVAINSSIKSIYDKYNSSSYIIHDIICKELDEWNNFKSNCGHILFPKNCDLYDRIEYSIEATDYIILFKDYMLKEDMFKPIEPTPYKNVGWTSKTKILYR